VSVERDQAKCEAVRRPGARPNPESLLAEAAKRLAAAGVESPRLDARLLMAEAKGDDSQFQFFISRRAAREPLAYITGAKEFWSLNFEVGPGVLIPRPESETIVEQVLEFFPDRTAPLAVLDLGTGTACLLVSLLMEYAKAGGLGIDASEQAREYAQRNLVRHGLAARARIQAADWSAATGSYDVIVSNPPYIKSGEIAALAPEVAQYEPALALDGGADGLAAYRALGPVLAHLLAPGGRAFLEIGAGQAGEVTAIVAGAGLETLRITPDLAGIERVVVAGRADPPEKTVGKARSNR